MVTPYAQVPLAFRIPGYVTSLKQVRADGAFAISRKAISVSKGAVLAHIRATEYEDKVRQATSEAEAAQAAACEGAARLRSCIAPLRSSEPDKARVRGGARTTRRRAGTIASCSGADGGDKGFLGRYHSRRAVLRRHCKEVRRARILRRTGIVRHSHSPTPIS